MEKPLVVHTREADEDTWDIMRTHLPENHRVLEDGQAKSLYAISSTHERLNGVAIR
jgi:Tat protein secretion system quality control protein TatD with DNase activity